MDIKSRVINEANYIINTKNTIRQTAKYFNKSKSTIHDDLHNKLKKIDKSLYAKVSDISCGTGTVDMKMAGKREDYSAEAEVGMGTVQIGDNVLSSGFGNEFSDKNDTGKELSIDCGMGDVQITFES